MAPAEVAPAEVAPAEVAPAEATSAEATSAAGGSLVCSPGRATRTGSMADGRRSVLVSQSEDGPILVFLNCMHILYIRCLIKHYFRCLKLCWRKPRLGKIVVSVFRAGI